MPIKNDPLSPLLQGSKVQQTGKIASSHCITKPQFGNDTFHKNNNGFSQAVIAELRKCYPNENTLNAFTLAQQEYNLQQTDDAVFKALPTEKQQEYTTAFAAAKRAVGVQIREITDEIKAIFRSIARAQDLTLVFKENGSFYFDQNNPPISFSDELIHEFKLTERKTLVTLLGLDSNASNESVKEIIARNNFSTGMKGINPTITEDDIRRVAATEIDPTITDADLQTIRRRN